MVLLDQGPLRRAAAEAYHRAGQRLAGLQATVNRFNTVDRPAFGSWLAASFGVLLTALRETEDAIHEKGPMLEAIRMLALLGGLSPREAYDDLHRDKAAFEKRAAQRAAGEAVDKAAEDDEGDFDEADPFAGMPEELRRMFGFPDSSGAGAGKKPPRAGQDGPEAPPARARHRAGNERAAKQPTPEQQTAAQRLKAAYRAVVRRLHPDVRVETSEYDRQLWHDAQNAYAKGDLERLETILAVSELAGKGVLPAGAGLGGLLALVRQMEGSVRSLERQVRTLKQDLAWGFAALKAREKLRQRVGNRLRQDVAAARAELAVIEGELEFCRQSPPRSQRGGGRGKKPGRAAGRPKKR